MGKRNKAAKRLRAKLTVKHRRIAAPSNKRTLSYRTETLWRALVGGVSHELRTPLASIMGSCSVLTQMPAILNDGRSRALVEVILEQAGQLDDKICNLLNATRISAKGLRPRLMWTDPTDIVAAAVKQKERTLAGHQVVVDLQSDLPLVNVDTALVEEALGQILENAAKFSPPGTEITIRSRVGRRYLDLSVNDHGSGLTPEEKNELGKRCYRSERHAAFAAGSGVGLWIASTFIAANGGSLFAESDGPHLGTTMYLRLLTVSQDSAELLDRSQ